jgi:formyl-CoA transferase
MAYNANKKSVTVNLKSERGLALVREMAKRADVFIENFAPGAAARLGLGWEAVHALNPRLIYAEIKGFGEGSPFEKFLAFDMIAQACGGVMSFTGEPDGRPIKPGPTLGDTGTGMLMAFSIASALFERERTGKGRRLSLAMQDAMLNYTRTAYIYQARTGKAAPRNGVKSLGGGNAPSGIYPCKGGGPNDYVYINTSRANPEHWPRLLKLIGREDLIGDPRFETPEARAERMAEVDEIVSAWTRRHDKRDAMERIGAVGVPSGAIFDSLELTNEPSFERRGIMQAIDYEGRRMTRPTWPVRFDGAPPAIAGAPSLGAHNAEIFGSWLGLGAAEVEVLRRDGIV